MLKKLFILFSVLLIMVSVLLVPVSAITASIDFPRPFVYSIPFSITFHEVSGVYNVSSALVPPILESDTLTDYGTYEEVDYDGFWLSIRNTYIAKDSTPDGDLLSLDCSMIMRPSEDFLNSNRGLEFTISSVGGFVPNSSENDLKIAFNGDVHVQGALTISTVTEKADGENVITHNLIIVNDTIPLGGGYFSLSYLTAQYVDPTLDFYYISDYELHFTLTDVVDVYETPEIYLDMLLLREDYASGLNFSFFDTLKEKLELNVIHGYVQGFDDGYEEGYIDGSAGDIEITDFTYFLGTAVSGFFDAEIFPGFSLTGAFTLILSVIFLVMVVRMLAD